MAELSEKRSTFPTDILYLCTFAAGMAGFWISGRAAALLPVLSNRGLQVAASLIVTAGVYGLGMLLLGLAALRRFRPALAAVLVAVVLGLIAAQAIVRIAAGHIHTKPDIAILSFGLYLCYGSIYVLGLAIGRKLRQ